MPLLLLLLLLLLVNARKFCGGIMCECEVSLFVFFSSNRTFVFRRSVQWHMYKCGKRLLPQKCLRRMQNKTGKCTGNDRRKRYVPTKLGTSVCVCVFRSFITRYHLEKCFSTLPALTQFFLDLFLSVKHVHTPILYGRRRVVLQTKKKRGKDAPMRTRTDGIGKWMKCRWP